MARIALSLLLLAAVALGAGPFARGQAVSGPGYFQRAQVVADGVWLLAEPGFQVQPTGNVTIIEQTDGLVLIDAGGSPGAGRRIVEQVRALSDKPVKAVVLTHWHGDHVQGLSEILKAWPQARTLATAATRAHLRDPAAMNSPATPDAAANAALQARIGGFAAYARKMAETAPSGPERAGWSGAVTLFEQYALDMDGALTVAPAEGFAEGLRLPDPRAPVELRFLGRANTDGDAVAWLPRQKVLVTGDIVVAPVPFGFGSYPADWIATLRKLERYPFAVLVPGHGQPQRDRSYLRRLLAALTEVRARIAPMVRAGVPDEALRRRADFDAQTRRFVGEDRWLRRWFGAYWLDAITASAAKEARGQPIVQSLKGD